MNQQSPDMDYIIHSACERLRSKKLVNYAMGIKFDIVLNELVNEWKVSREDAYLATSAAKILVEYDDIDDEMPITKRH